MLVAALLVSAAACNKQPDAPSAPAAEAGISGTWKADLGSVQIDQKPDAYLVKDGQYSCESCTPKVAVAADGAFHPVSGSPYYDSTAVKVVDDHTITRTNKMADKVIGETTLAVAADGQMFTGTFKDTSTPDAPPVTGKYTEARVAPAPAGAHAISGSWKPAKYENVSDEGLIVTFNQQGDTFSMSSPAGQSYTAKLDGTDAPIKGDTTGAVASVERVSANVYRETDKRDGKVIGVATMTVGADGKLNVVFDNKERGSTTKYTAIKQ
ncbi:MAG: hypothetical protein H0W65_01830 [Sphingomonas sp.]|nr:hypothetical protein [Sphingomonas sp.]